MSAIPPLYEDILHFHTSAPQPCPYLEGRVERKLFTRISETGARDTIGLMTRAGFRRSLDLIYRPVCPACSACVPVRVVAHAFAPSRSQRRILRANADVSVATGGPHATPEQYRLFLRYQRDRHPDSEMAAMVEGDYLAMVESGAQSCRIVEFREPDGTLVGAALFDLVGDGVSAIYSFFDPDRPQRSLGTFIILSLIEIARSSASQAYVYLGYWIGGSRKMAYKANFRPFEHLGPEGWQTAERLIESADGQPSLHEST